MPERSKPVELVTVYASMGPLRAEVIKSKLEAAGIPVLLSYESAGVVIGILADGLGEVRVQVPREYEADALALIEPLEPGDWDEEPDFE